MPDRPDNLYDAKNQVERGVRTVEGAIGSAMHKTKDFVSKHTPEGVKDLMGYRTKSRQRKTDIRLPGRRATGRRR